jgi:hypothetical protein
MKMIFSYTSGMILVETDCSGPRVVVRIDGSALGMGVKLMESLQMGERSNG